MKFDKSKLKINRTGVEEIPVPVEYSLAYLAKLPGLQDETYISIQKQWE